MRFRKRLFSVMMEAGNGRENCLWDFGNWNDSIIHLDFESVFFFKLS
jgi:hypothetical protein